MRELINLITETPDEVRAEIEQKIKKIPDEPDLIDVLKFTNQFALKKDVQSFTTLRNYKGLVSSVFLQALASANLDQQTVQKFLNKLSKDGILNEKMLMTTRQVHNYVSLIDPEWHTVFNLIKGDLFEKISGKIGEMGDVGKGEYLLDIISPHVNRRGAPGDLDIGGTKVELKAGKSGRLGPAGSQSLVGRFREFQTATKNLVPPEKWKTIPTDKTELGEMFNPKIKMGTFSAFFEKNTNKALEVMLKMHYPEYNVKPIVAACVDINGNIDGGELKKQMLKAAFSVYKAAKSFDGIIIMDAEVTKFLYVNSPDDIAEVASSLTVKFPSWTEQQSNCMKVTLRSSVGNVVDPSSPDALTKIAKANPVDVPQVNKAETKKAMQAKVLEFAKNYAYQKKIYDQALIDDIAQVTLTYLSQGYTGKEIVSLLNATLKQFIAQPNAETLPPTQTPPPNSLNQPTAEPIAQPHPEPMSESARLGRERRK